jgi:hypothetical protein
MQNLKTLKLKLLKRLKVTMVVIKPAKIAASSPPAAALISTITSFSSLGSFGINKNLDYKSKKEEIAEIDEMLNETEDKEEIEMLKEESASSIHS